ncbi:hypothetical protein Y032_0019g3814 [Ancylostoma ceylanicum]|uniref:Uncharacterized protein n=1 Tax=Ancylostoma ceylanicum TaxID=53326 RepID=A0A016V1U4_9BILA|nr:hypothetical protein Y032_0019g3814 [Ancylostoma ceylanicum]
MGSFASPPSSDQLRRCPMVPTKMLVAVLLFDDDGCLDRQSTLQKILLSRRHDPASRCACPHRPVYNLTLFHLVV